MCNESCHLSIHLLDSRPLRILCVLCHVISLITFIDRYDCYPAFTNEETEAHIVVEFTLQQHRFKTAWVHLYLDFFQLVYSKNFWRYVKIWKNTFFSLTYFVVRVQYVIHMTYKMCVDLLFATSKAYDQQKSTSS